MAIKKPQLKADLKKKPAPPEEVEQPKKGLKKKAPPVEDDTDGDDDDDDDDAPKKGAKKKAKLTGSLADLFNETKPGRQGFKIGTFKFKVMGYEMDGEIADDIEDQEDLKITVTYEGHEDEEDDVAGKNLKQVYTIFKDGEFNEVGAGILKGDLDMLGYEDITLENLEEIFEDVAQTEPVVVIKTKENKGYVNGYLQGLADEN